VTFPDRRSVIGVGFSAPWRIMLMHSQETLCGFLRFHQEVRDGGKTGIDY
jgi:hypothetical protein